MGVLRRMRVILTGSVSTNFSWPQRFISGDKNVFPLAQGGLLLHGSFTSCFQKEKWRSECSSCTCCFQVSLAQNNHYAKAAYLE